MIVTLYVLIIFPSLIILPLQLTFQICIHILHTLCLILIFAFSVRNAKFQQLISSSQIVDTLVVPVIGIIAPFFAGFFSPLQFPGESALSS